MHKYVCITRTKVNFHCDIHVDAPPVWNVKRGKRGDDERGWWFAILSRYLLFKYPKWWNISKSIAARHRYHTRENTKIKSFRVKSYKGTCRRQFAVRFTRLCASSAYRIMFYLLWESMNGSKRKSSSSCLKVCIDVNDCSV